MLCSRPAYVYVTVTAKTARLNYKKLPLCCSGFWKRHHPSLPPLTPAHPHQDLALELQLQQDGPCALAQALLTLQGRAPPSLVGRPPCHSRGQLVSTFQTSCAASASDAVTLSLPAAG